MEIDETLSKLVSNTEEIRKKIESLEEKIKSKDNEIESLNNEIENLKNPSSELDCGLLGKLNNIQWDTWAYATYQIENNSLIVNGTSRYASIRCMYYELEKDYVPNVRTKYLLHVEGYKEKGCTAAYIVSTEHLISTDKFSMDLEILASWQRQILITIMLNQSAGEDSKLVITSLKLKLF